MTRDEFALYEATSRRWMALLSIEMGNLLVGARQVSLQSSGKIVVEYNGNTPILKLQLVHFTR